MTARSRTGRVSSDAVFELARHLTVRDRAILVRLFDVQLLATDQLALLFFSSLRRCQDRLLFLYRHRLIDRFYPPSPFGYGKPQAHWLLDEAGAILVAAIKRVDRKQLGWQRRDDWASHPQLAHRLESNRFVTDLIAATLPDPRVGVTSWWSSRDAAKQTGAPDQLRPDAAFLLDLLAGPVHCVLEWDRGTETQARLAEKLDNYRISDTGWREDGQPTSVLFVVPSLGRVKTLRRALIDIEPVLERRRQGRPDHPTLWPLLVTTVGELRERGALERVWESIPDEHEPLRSLTELPIRSDLGSTNVALALGREWRYDQLGFWDRLSPLHRRGSAVGSLPRMPAATGEPEEESWVVRYRHAEMEEMRRKAAAFTARLGTSPRSGGGALNPGGEDGLMDGDLDDGLDDQEESWA